MNQRAILDDNHDARAHTERMSQQEYDDRQRERDFEFNKMRFKAANKQREDDMRMQNEREQRNREERMNELPYINDITESQLKLNEQKHRHDQEKAKNQLQLNEQMHRQRMERMNIYPIKNGKNIPEGNDEKYALMRMVAQQIGFDFDTHDYRDAFMLDNIREPTTNHLYVRTLFFAGVADYGFDHQYNLEIHFYHHHPMTLYFDGHYFAVNIVQSQLLPGIMVIRILRSVYKPNAPLPVLRSPPPYIIGRYCPRLKDCNIY